MRSICAQGEQGVLYPVPTEKQGLLASASSAHEGAQGVTAALRGQGCRWGPPPRAVGRCCCSTGALGEAIVELWRVSAQPRPPESHPWQTTPKSPPTHGAEFSKGSPPALQPPCKSWSKESSGLSWAFFSHGWTSPVLSAFLLQQLPRPLVTHPVQKGEVSFKNVVQEGKGLI